MPQGDLSPAQLRRVFGANLKLLAKAAPSVSQLCRDLGINRTQFNRYLNAEAFPRPDVLYRICLHFKVDARILLEPLASLHDKHHDEGAAVWEVSSFLSDSGLLKIASEALPDGPYLYYRPSYFVQASISCTLVSFSRDETDAIRLRGYMPRSASDRIGLGRAAPDRRFRGLVFRQLLGFSFMISLERAPLMVLGGVEPNYMGNSKFYFGSAISTQDVLSPGPVLLERLDPKLSTMMTARHKIGIQGRDQLSPLVRGFFDKYAPLK